MTTQELIIAVLDARGARSWLNPVDAATATLLDCERLVRRSYGPSDLDTVLQTLSEVLCLALATRDPSPATEAA